MVNLEALAGGVGIGFAVSLFLLLLGRVAGISGILEGALTQLSGEEFLRGIWRWSFLLGLLLGGLTLSFVAPETLSTKNQLSWHWLVLAGLLVGFGTSLGSGCTSGHGVCGVSRFAKRSIAATITFILFGVMTVALLKAVGVLA